MNQDQLLLIDLSAIGHQIWHVSGSEPDPSYVSTQIIARVRSLAASHPHAAICCDSGKSFRAEIDPTYKANRDTENRAPLKHQMDVACATLKRDGFPVWAVKGFEADDLIATAVAKAADIDETSVLIVTADKDLFQLVTDRVAVKSIITGNVIDAAAVREKFKVTPAQMHDYLCLVGDTSDNIVGAEGIGPVTAAAILSKFGTLVNFYEKLTSVPHLSPDMKQRAKFLAAEFGIGDKQRVALMEFKDRWPTVSKLIALRADAPIPFEEIAAERTAAAMVEEPSMAEEYPAEQSMAAFVEQEARERKSTYLPLVEAVAAQAVRDGATELTTASAANAEHIAPRQTDIAVSAPPVDYSQQLEPRSMTEAIQLAQRMYDSRLFSAYGTPQAVLATVLAGRELGIPAMAALRAFHIIEGKPQLSAGAIQSLVIKSGKATYFRCSERTPTRATFVTKRGDDPEMALSYTIEEGRAAWPKDDMAWKKSGWGRNPADMLVARASSKLARLVYPDVVSGLYAPEEMD